MHHARFTPSRQSWFTGLIAVAALGLALPASAAHHGHDDSKDSGKSGKSGKKNVVETAMAKDQFSTLVKAVKAAGLVETLKGEGPYTVFAPTNEAFKALPQSKLDSLMKSENKQKLKDVLTYHVVPGKVMVQDVMSLDGVKSDQGAMVKTVQGSEATLKAKGGNVMIDGAKVTKTDIKTSNGVIHVIDAVITPKNKKSGSSDDSEGNGGY
jgi:uncharacterized surface protein with fasciclin (FAS1) repeats